MSDVDLRFVQYLDSIEHDYGYMLQTSAYVCLGWMQLIQDMLSEIKNLGAEESPVFTDIKDKYGTLRVYGYNISDEAQDIITKYARLSGETCMTCGAPGKMHVKNKWLYVACAEHANGGLAEDED